MPRMPKERVEVWRRSVRRRLRAGGRGGNAAAATTTTEGGGDDDKGRQRVDANSTLNAWMTTEGGGDDEVLSFIHGHRNDRLYKVREKVRKFETLTVRKGCRVQVHVNEGTRFMKAYERTVYCCVYPDAPADRASVRKGWFESFLVQGQAQVLHSTCKSVVQEAGF